jgi:hypothetical protein
MALRLGRGQAAAQQVRRMRALLLQALEYELLSYQLSGYELLDHTTPMILRVLML